MGGFGGQTATEEWRVPISYKEEENFLDVSHI